MAAIREGVRGILRVSLRRSNVLSPLIIEPLLTRRQNDSSDLREGKWYFGPTNIGGAVAVPVAWQFDFISCPPRHCLWSSKASHLGPPGLPRFIAKRPSQQPMSPVAGITNPAMEQPVGEFLLVALHRQ